MNATMKINTYLCTVFKNKQQNTIAKLEKDLRNSVNRRLNCDSANLDKAVLAAQEQMESIRALQEAGLLEQLPDKLQLTAALRLENPELTLSELAEEFDPPVSKSCLNHRLRKLRSMLMLQGEKQTR